MWFHLCLGNHSEIGKWTLADHVQWLEAGLTELGHAVTIGDSLAPHSTNVLWDGFSPGQGRWLRDSGVQYGIVATEMPDGEGFNNRRDHEWQWRWPAFAEAAAGAKFIWSTIEESIPAYIAFAPTSFFEFGFSERLVPYEAGWDPEADFGFYGLVTPYRQEILERIEKRCKVYRPANDFMAPGEMARFIARCKIILCFKQAPDWSIPSPTRLGRALLSRRGIANEFVPVPTRQGRLIPIAPEGADYAEFCLERLNGPWKRDAHEAFDRYRAEMPMRRIVERLLDETVARGNIAAAKTIALTDEERIFSRVMLHGSKRDPILVSSYQGYNLVRFGDDFVAVAQELGPLDVAAVMQGDVERPASDKFMMGKNADDLRRMIDGFMRSSGAGGTPAPNKSSPDPFG